MRLNVLSNLQQPSKLTTSVRDTIIQLKVFNPKLSFLRLILLSFKRKPNYSSLCVVEGEKYPRSTVPEIN